MLQRHLPLRALYSYVRRTWRLLRRNVTYWILGSPDGLAIPPLKLRKLVWSEYADIASFFEGQEAKWLLQILTECGAPVERFEAILDFGCGAGRVVRQFHFLEGVKVHGTDINPDQIEWCGRNISFAHFGQNDPYPPLSYPNDTFDFIYTFSVFTHLPESEQAAWLAELERVLKPGGFLLITTCGESYVSLLTAQEKKQFRAGNVVVRHGELARDPEKYGECIAYHPISHVTEKLANKFQLAKFIPGESLPNAPKGEMDHYFLRKPNLAHNASAETPC
jgi:SAM-dependent methyltransferase